MTHGPALASVQNDRAPVLDVADFDVDAYVREFLAGTDERDPNVLTADLLDRLSHDELAAAGAALLRRRVVEGVRMERVTRRSIVGEQIAGGGSPKLQAIREAQELHPFDCWYQLPDGSGGYLRDFTAPQVERLAAHRKMLAETNRREQKRFERLVSTMRDRGALKVGRLPRGLGSEIFGV